MIKKEKLPQAKLSSELSDIKNTNHLFLELLYDLSKYPHTQSSKYLVRQGLFDFEKNYVFRALKQKRK